MILKNGFIMHAGSFLLIEVPWTTDDWKKYGQDPKNGTSADMPMPMPITADHFELGVYNLEIKHRKFIVIDGNHRVSILIGLPPNKVCMLCCCVVVLL